MISRKNALLCLGLLLLAGCSTAGRKPLETQESQTTAHAVTPPPPPAEETRGLASWYGRKFHRKRTASGERFNMYGLTAAHRTLPFGSKVLVRNLRNGKTVTVRINDRGPYSENRLIDLSYGAARSLGIVHGGVADVEIQILKRS